MGAVIGHRASRRGKEKARSSGRRKWALRQKPKAVVPIVTEPHGPRQRQFGPQLPPPPIEKTSCQVCGRSIEDPAGDLRLRLANLEFTVPTRVLGTIWAGLTYPIQRVGRWAGDFREDFHHADLIGSLMGLEGRLVVVVGAEHPEQSGPHPDNVDANAGLLRVFKKSSFWFRAEMVPDAVAANRIVLGSPTSTREVGRFLGITDSAGQLRPGVAPITVQYAFGQRSNVTAKRFVGGVLVDRRLTTIYDVTSRRPMQLRGLRPGDWLPTDYLLLTCLPNLLDRRAFRAGYRYVSLAGLTGVGTKASAVLVNDTETLQAIRRAIGSSRYFQVLLRVAVQHQDDSFGSPESAPVPGSLEIVDATQLEVDEDRIERFLEFEARR
jgi:hypothetical protein